MSARYLRATKPVRAKGCKGVGAIIVTTLAFDTAAHQYTNPLMFNTGEDFYDTDNANNDNRTVQQHGSDSNSTPAPRSEGTHCLPGTLRENTILEVNPLTEQGTWICRNLVPIDDDVGSQHKPSRACPAQSSDLVELGQLPLATPPVKPSIQSLTASDISETFHKAALRCLPALPPQTEGEDSLSVKSIELDIPPFLHPDNRVDNPRSKAIKSIAALHQANQVDQAIAAMRAQFSEGEFEKHLFSRLRQKMFRLGTRRFLRRDLASRDPLLCTYSKGLQEWCASVFDATVRRVKFTTDSSYRLSKEDPITKEVYFHPQVDTNFPDLKNEILEARGGLQGYFKSEPELRKAVNTIKWTFTDRACKDWRAYKAKYSLTHTTVKTKDLREPSRSLTYLSKNTHFISWLLRHSSPSSFLHRRAYIINAIKAIEGDSSMLADVLEHLCVLDVADFEGKSRKLEKEKFHSHVKVPQE